MGTEGKADPSREAQELFQGETWQSQVRDNLCLTESPSKCPPMHTPEVLRLSTQGSKHLRDLLS